MHGKTVHECIQALASTSQHQCQNKAKLTPSQEYMQPRRVKSKETRCPFADPRVYVAHYDRFGLERRVSNSSPC